MSKANIDGLVDAVMKELMDFRKITEEEFGNGKFEFVVHNKKKPGLTHLLERGHQSNRGGRVKGIVHIKPVEEWCNEEFERRAEARLGR